MFSLDSALTVVCAPTGFGARTLIRSWLHSDAVRTDPTVVWISPPKEEQGPGEYWQSIRETINPYWSALQPASRVGGDDDMDSVQVMVDLFSMLRHDYVLVLERLDTVSDPPEVVVETINRLMQSPGIRIIVTVGEPSKLGDMLVRVSDTSVRAQDLLFSAAETIQWCQELGLSQPQVIGQRIYVSSGGIACWVARAVELARHRAEPIVDVFGRPNPELLKAVTGDLQQLFGTSDPNTAPAFRSLVLAMAPARLVTEEVAADLLPKAASPKAAVEIVRNSGLTVAADQQEDTAPGWYFPDVVRKALLRLATDENPGHIQSVLMYLSRRASECEDHLLAAQYAADAGNWVSTLDIVEKHWVGMVTHHLPQLRALLDVVPDEFLHNRPSIKAGKAVFVGMLAHTPTLGPMLPESDDDLAKLAADPAVATTIHVVTVQSMGLRVAGRYREAMTLTHRLVTLTSAAIDRQPHLVSGQLPVLRLQWAITFQLAGDEVEASVQFMQAYRGGVAADIEFVARNSAGNLAMLWALAGHVPRAEMWLAREVDLHDGGAVLAPMVRIGGLVATALTHLDRLDTARTEAVLTELGEPTHREELWAYIAYAHAQFALMTGSAYSGLAMVQRLVAERVPQCSASSFARVLITAARTDLHLALGQANLAEATINEMELDHPLLAAAAARVALYTGQPEEALAIVAHSSTPAAGAPRIHIEALLVRAAAHLALGASEPAVQCWRTACELAQKSMCYRPFTTVPDSVRRELSEAAETSTIVEVSISVFPDVVAFVRLSPREQIVLSGLAQGLSAQRIADDQYVSVHTVRSQMRTVYRKLGAHSKAEAIAIARTLRLLDNKSEASTPFTLYDPDDHRN
ncbi:LuxR C-terminal-related transcriptional regulator [Rhodococcus rhodochrous]|uniref:helix-turn-helix transcriptional regulator n=1 Tax=Rhodococcus rhodochrous TaxID=1829 RepID=UPI001E33C5DA|nr:LuxR C-terminal-related transcriptional regulator [Rhodococcus rhodochrous]MCB8914109.1 LuxR C-terminal-related transcriptional regulator [Rhodococcus rhodochrous]